jgi:biopolymer transport protein ExbB/TolQ
MESLDLMHIWATMSLLAKLVTLCLVGMAVGSLYVAFERILVLRRTFASSAEFARKSRPLLEALEMKAVRDLTRTVEFEQAPLAKITQVGVEAWLRHEEEEGAVEFVRRDLSRKLDQLAAEARRGMGFLATVGSTAPFVGLFGTVIGIIVAFTGIAESGGGGLDAVSAGIAEALIVTAIGLIVAIFSVWIFNYLNGHFDRLDMRLQHAAGELIDFMELSRGRSA